MASSSELDLSYLTWEAVFASDAELQKEETLLTK